MNRLLLTRRLSFLVCALSVCFAGLVNFTSNASAADKDSRVYEMRIYYAAEGKLDALHARFRDHTMKLFEKHGMTNIGYWVPIENPDRMLIYILAYPSREAASASWKAFGADPDWQKARTASEVDGKLVAKVDSKFYQTTDYSPEVVAKKNPERVFELRTYTATPGNLDGLNARFRDFTAKGFEKHGMTNIGYWTLLPNQKESDVTLMYILAHKSRDAAKESFAAFGKDPDWTAARKASEEKAGGSLTIPGGVKSVFMKATDYSPMQ